MIVEGQGETPSEQPEQPVTIPFAELEDCFRAEYAAAKKNGNENFLWGIHWMSRAVEIRFKRQMNIGRPEDDAPKNTPIELLLNPPFYTPLPPSSKPKP